MEDGTIFAALEARVKVLEEKVTAADNNHEQASLISELYPEFSPPFSSPVSTPSFLNRLLEDDYIPQLPDPISHPLAIQQHYPYSHPPYTPTCIQYPATNQPQYPAFYQPQYPATSQPQHPAFNQPQHSATSQPQYTAAQHHDTTRCKLITNKHCIPSSSINRSCLEPVSVVLDKYAKLRQENVVGKLASIITTYIIIIVFTCTCTFKSHKRFV